jgi:hypothetical protein
MKETYSHKVTESFYLWFDHHLLDQGKAFRNVGSQLYPSTDPRVPNTLAAYSSPFKQWVYDSSVIGAQIPSGVYVNGVFTPRGGDVSLDFDNGRAFVNASGADFVSGNYAVKEFNTYVVANEDARVVYDGTFQVSSPFNMIPETGVNTFGFTAPACFIMNTTTDNKPFALGGEQSTENKMRVIVVSDDIYQLDGCISLFRDLANSIIPLVNVADDPFNEYGDLKSGQFNYSDLSTARQGRSLFIDKVSATKITTAQQNKSNPVLRYGIIDFYLSEPRVPKLDL